MYQTNGAEDDDKDNLYNLLRQVISKSEEKEMTTPVMEVAAEDRWTGDGQCGIWTRMEND